MELLTIGLICLGVLFVKEGGELLINSIDKAINSNWYELTESLKLDKYKIKNKETMEYGTRLLVDLPPGGTVTKIEENQEAIEKAYKCRCLINNIPFSNLVEIDLITKEIKGLKQPLMLLTDHELLLGYNLKGIPIIVDMSSTPHLGVVGTSKMWKSNQ